MKIEFSKEEVEYLIECMECLDGECNGRVKEYSSMRDKLDMYSRSRFGCFISRNGELKDLSEEESDKAEAEKIERKMQTLAEASRRNFRSASSAVQDLKRLLLKIETMRLEGVYLNQFTYDQLRAIEKTIEWQWNNIFEGYPEMKGLISIHIDEDLDPYYWVHTNVTDEELDEIFFPESLLPSVSKIVF